MPLARLPRRRDDQFAAHLPCCDRRPRRCAAAYLRRVSCTSAPPQRAASFARAMRNSPSLSPSFLVTNRKRALQTLAPLKPALLAHVHDADYLRDLKSTRTMSQEAINLCVTQFDCVAATNVASARNSGNSRRVGRRRLGVV